ncbi:2-oxoglutarate and iron-dependent oxygenase domain-containing protein 3-like [Eriocheir sinensis]|uniref:2-oxoglutarate and iron-dependent oxygenase domain-containing protein 3-like n=1 Tax=Eriocheir sinensis TaxID=95602 RepID=UPI0021C892EA|nr:2-oxoglutarate and iron-dependent oxygenase domain-containing protein 3-like [Eriocheir sinensis]
MTVKQRNNRKTPGNTKPPTKTDPKNGSEKVNVRSGIRIDWRRIFTRLVMISAIMVAVYFSKANKMVLFAKQDEEITKKSVEISCSEDYAEELKHFQGCTPRKCGRMVSDILVKPSEVAALRNIAERGLALGGSSGGASILDLHSGALSKGNAFVNIYKLELSKTVFTSEDFKIYSHVKTKIHHAIADHFGIDRGQLYLTHPTFFSRITPAPAQTIHDEYWHPHVDKETYESFHYTSLLYLANYGQDFEGGRFVFIDRDSNKTVEPRQGRVSAFTSGSENLHFVEQVTSGTRYAITVSFTCDPKHAIEDPKLQR